MTANPLLTAFAEQLGLSEDDARPALERVVAALRATIESGAESTIEGIGSFARSNQGTTFAPDPLLVASVNGDFAGLEPVSEPVPVPFLTAFPVVPAVAAEEPVITPADTAHEGEAPADPAAAPAPEDVTIELGPNDDLGVRQRQEEHDQDLAAMMAGVWTPPPSPPLAPLETPDREAAHGHAGGPDGDETLSFSEAEFSFVDAPAQDAPVDPVPAASAAPFAATATAAPAPVVHVSEVDGQGGDWNRLWLVAPLLVVLIGGIWLLTRRGPDSAPEPLASQPTTGATGAGAPLAAGGGPVGAAADSALAASAEAADAVDEPPAADHATADAAPAASAAPGPRDAPIRLAPVPRRATERDAAAAPPTAPAERTGQAPAEAARVEPMRAGPPRAEPTRPPDPAFARGAPPTAGAGAWGLRGTAPVDPAAGGMTWVLASTDAGEARERVAIYRSQGFRSAVLPASVGGRQTHRVAVGQFADAAAARAARALLPPDAPADAWLLRLHP